MFNYIIKSDNIKPEVLETTANTVNSYELKGGIMTLEQALEKKGEKKGEKREKREIAKNLKNFGILTAEQISQATGLTIEEIEKL